MAYKKITAEQAYRIGLMLERAAKLRAQAESVSKDAFYAMRAAGLDPETDGFVANDGDITVNGAPLPAGVVMRNGRPVHDDSTTPSESPLASVEKP